MIETKIYCCRGSAAKNTWVDSACEERTPVRFRNRKRFGHLLEFNDSSRKSDDCAINHGRCLWIKNPEFMTAQSLKEAVAEMEEIREDSTTILKRLENERSEGVV